MQIVSTNGIMNHKVGGDEPLLQINKIKEYRMYKTNKRSFDITMKQSGRSKWYTAVHTKEDGERIVYVRNNLSSLKAFIKAKGDTPNVRFW